ncbi:MAG: PAS domain-containing protein, partial [Limnothrix sp. RL_2_0]|nr:PAS domain-containing protein [Limnothrix sp. RL_2_0]
AIALVNDEEAPEIDSLYDMGIADYLDMTQLNPAKVRRSFYQMARCRQAQQQSKQLTQRIKHIDERYRLTLEGLKDGIWDWTVNQPNVEGNERLREMLGFPINQLPLDINHLKALIHPQDYAKVKTALHNHINNQEDFSVEIRIRHTTGEYRDYWVRGKVQTLKPQGQARMCGLITDITERKRSDRRNQFLSQSSSLLNASLDSQATIENLAWLAVPRIADWCILKLNLKATKHDPAVTKHIDPDKEPLVRTFHDQLIAVDPCPQSLQFAHDLSDIDQQNLAKKYDWSLPLLEKLQLRSYVWIPLRVGKRFMGSIFFAWGETERHCDPADLALIQELAYRATWSIENERLYDERETAYNDLQGAMTTLRKQQQRLETLQRLTTLINCRLTNIPDLLKGLVHQICKNVPAAQLCSIALFDRKQKDDFFVVTDGVQPQAIALDALLSQDENWLLQVYETGKPHLQDFEAQAPMPCSMAAVPIESVDAGRLGVLVIGNWQIPKAFTLEDCEFLAAVGEEAAIAIDNARLIKTLEQQNQELSEISRVKDLFLARVSHELRTPMNAILGFSQVLLSQRKTLLGDREKHILQRILNNGRSLMALINDILDFSQMRLTEIKLLPSTFDLENLVINIVEELQSIADEKQLRLALSVELENPQITHDQKRIRQVLVNLIANALSFTQQGTVEIVLRAAADKIFIDVKDTGIGIAPEDLDHIFSEFWQVQQDLHRTNSGTGLGLAITHALVQQMQGAIAVESVANQGSKFTVTLPRTLTQQAITEQ